MMVASLGGSLSKSSSSSSSSKLNYAVTADSVGITSKTSSSTVEVKKLPSETVDNHGYRVANHDNERCFWLNALQNLEPSSSSEQSLWGRIALANAPEKM